MRPDGAIEGPPAATFHRTSQTEPIAHTGLAPEPELPAAPPNWESRIEVRAPETGLRPLESRGGGEVVTDPGRPKFADAPPELGFREEEQPVAQAMRFAPRIAGSEDRAAGKPALPGLPVKKIGRALDGAELILEVRSIAKRSFSTCLGAGFLRFEFAPRSGVQPEFPRAYRMPEAGPRATPPLQRPRTAEPAAAGVEFSVADTMLEYPALPGLEPGILASAAPEVQGATDAMGGAGPLVRLPKPTKQAAVPAPAAEAPAGDARDSVVLPAPALMPALPQGELSLRSLWELALPVAWDEPARLRAEDVRAMTAQTRAPASSMRLRAAFNLACAPHMNLPAGVTSAFLPGWRAAGCTFLAAPVSIPAGTDHTVLRAALAERPAVTLPGVPVRGIVAVRGASWQSPPSANPEIIALSATHPAAVLCAAALSRQAAVPAGAMIHAAPRPRESAFPLREALLPVERTLPSLCGLPGGMAMDLPPRPAVCIPEVRQIGSLFAQRDPLLAENALADPAARTRCLEARLFEPAPAPMPRELEQGRNRRLALMPVALTAEIERAAACLKPAAPSALGVAGAEPWAPASPNRLESVPRAPEQSFFPARAPRYPGSMAVHARRVLEGAPAIASAARVLAGAARSERVEAAMAPATRDPELPMAAAAVRAFRLANAAHRALVPGGLQNRSPRQPAGWSPFTQEEPGFAQLRSLFAGVRWTGADGCGFAAEPERQPGIGDIRRAAAHGAPEFDLPTVCRPELSGRRAALPGAELAGLAAPALRDDARTGQRKARLAPTFRLHNRPSRLPVFHATTEKGHMPAGVFCYVEHDDRDDERTATLAPFAGAELPGPVCPDGLQPVCPRRSLAEAPMVDTLGNGLPGAACAAGGHEERTFQSEPFFVEAGLPILGVDFAAIIEAYEPRWRSALKTASGLFRGVMLSIPAVLALSAMSAGCSTSNGGSLREKIQNRAVVRLEHNFSRGLDGWYGGREWARTWVREPSSGFVRVGELALYRPAQPFTDYSFEFLGQIEGGSMSWIYRATDLQNYYVSTLLVERPGPVPAMAIEHYRVIDGQQSKHERAPVQMVLHNGRPYRIQQDVVGNGFTTSINGETADFWTDGRLTSGTVGFFGEKGSTPHLYWMKVSYQDDLWGKFCATIAPR
ncbi:MAG TPA: hypothetical protein VF767_05260 [Bryobacteraceae bacterium]